MKVDMGEKQMPGGKDNMEHGQHNGAGNKEGQMEDKMTNSWKTK